ncbi:MAG TPA: pectinesterase family protein [Tepidisphaeraceae bacterium]|jgi:pectinesterase|nr:pectinesterase family protein [Tepidisphaeraceae bacterium]
MRNIGFGKSGFRWVLCAAGVAGVLGSVVAPVAKASEYLVNASYAGPNGAAEGPYSGVYNTINAAFAAVGSGASVANPNYIYFAPGTYNVGTTSLSYSKSNVDLIGLSGNPNDVIITSTLDSAYNTGSGTIGTSGSATLQLKGNNVTAAYLTFANSTDTPYIVNDAHQAVSPTGSYATGQSQTTNDPAVALLLQGDEQVFDDVNVLGYQDTLYTKGGRSYFVNSTISGDVDFIFANGTTVFNNSTINIDGDHSGGDIVAPSTDKRTSNGLVFLNSTITGNSVKGNAAIDPMNAANANGPAANSMYLGRPWGWEQAGGDSSAVFINAKMANVIEPAGWLAWNSAETTSNANNNGNPAEDSRFAEYNSTDLLGNSINTSSRVSWSHQLTAAQAADYTVDNIFSESYPWYGDGYPSSDASNPGTGSANPSDPNYSWPAFWGDRNAQNAAADDNVLNNPSSYSDPSWTLGGNWDPTAQLDLIVVPEPATLALLGGFAVLPLMRRPRRRTLAA